MTKLATLSWLTRIIVMIASGMISIASASDAWAGGNRGNQFGQVKAVHTVGRDVSSAANSGYHFVGGLF
jgi:hypothetical protein